jgi:hypothetical protein
MAGYISTQRARSDTLSLCNCFLAAERSVVFTVQKQDTNPRSFFTSMILKLHYSLQSWFVALPFLYCASEAGSGLRSIIRHDAAKLQHTVASPKNRVPQDLSTHAKESISLQKASPKEIYESESNPTTSPPP